MSCALVRASATAAWRRCSSLSPDLVARRPLAGLGALARLEWSELLSARAFWLLLALVGPLVGQAFRTAVSTYAELSGGGGAPGALAQGMSPLDGIVVPTLGAYDLVVTFLAPFVAIRLVAAERESGAAKLAAQAPVTAATRLLAKLLALAGGALLAALPGAVALLLWRAYGGHLYVPETAAVALGHALHALLLLAVAIAAAAVARSSASAAILALGVTIGAWALDFVGAVHSGLLARLAAFTPGAALHAFEQGDVRLRLLIVPLLLALAFLVVAAVALDPFRGRRARAVAVAAVLVMATGATALAARARGAWDLAEDRRSSFSRADEAALRRIGPVQVEARLAPEDPRRADLERNVLAKLERVVPRLDVTYTATGGTGLFAASDPGYGEIWYQVGGRRSMLRSTIEPVVLAELYRLAGVPASGSENEASYPGYPLRATARGAAPLFYLVMPVLVAGGYRLAARRRRSPWPDA